MTLFVTNDFPQTQRTQEPPRWKFQSLRLETERGIISNGVKADRGWLYLFEQLCRHLLQALLPDAHRVEGNQDDTNEAGHGEE